MERTVLAGRDFSETIPPELKTGKYELRGKNGSFYLTDEMLSMGLLMLGSTGCGKTTQLVKLLDQIVPALTDKDTMIIFDSKGDFYDRYYEPGNPRHIVVSLSQKHKEFAAPWNVYRELIDDFGKLSVNEIDINSSENARALGRGMDNEMQPFFSLAAAELIAKAMAATVKDAFRTHDSSQLNNHAFNQLLSSDRKKLIDKITKYEEYEYIHSYVGDGSTPQSLGVYGHAMAVKSRAFIGSFDKDDLEHDFGVREFIRNKGGKRLFLEYDVRYKETLETVYSLLFDLAIKEALSVKGGNKWFICDEASLLPYLQHIGDLLNFGRSYGCKTIFAIQSYAQLEVNYDEQKAAAISAGFCNLFAFKNTDYKSRKYVKERCGETFEEFDYGGQILTRDSFTVRDSDLADLKTGEAFIDINNSSPFKVRFEG